MVTQCGIPPGKSFTYVYNLDQSGTYWIHGHDHYQNVDGLRAPLVIYDKDQPPHGYDKDILLSFEDWFGEEISEREAELLAPNGGVFPQHRYGFGLVNGGNGNHSKPLHVTPGRRYRIRLVNMGSLNWFKFRLPGHQMRVIEADGVYTKPLEVDVVDISPGQRYSVVFTAHNTDQFNYRYNATLHSDAIPAAQGLVPRIYLGDIIYKKGALFKHIPSVDESDLIWLDDINLIPLDDEPEMSVDRIVIYNLGDAIYSTNQRLYYLNNITYAQPNVPTLYTVLTMGAMAMNKLVYGPQTNALVLRHNEVIELVIHNQGRLPQPIYLQGHSFQITEYGPADLLVENLNAPANISVRKCTGPPVKRDTMVIPKYQYIKFRVRADNPGVWLLHSHLDMHFAMGLALTIIEAPDMLQKTLKIPPEMLGFCNQQGIPISGNAAGNEGLNFTGLSNPPTIVTIDIPVS
ncbi:ferroxidase fet3 [Coemansia sp. RSA 1933]|nr:ferroxidase fet3 [Coemansia sp. RSA 1933]